jgi:hypothetical protein
MQWLIFHGEVGSDERIDRKEDKRVELTYFVGRLWLLCGNFFRVVFRGSHWLRYITFDFELNVCIKVCPKMVRKKKEIVRTIND